MKPTFPDDILALVAGRGKAADAIGDIPESGMPDPLPVPPEVEPGQPDDVGPPADMPPVDIGQPADTPPVDTGNLGFDDDTGLPLIAMDSGPDPFPGEEAEIPAEAADILGYLF